ncbi:MAG: substrate-binding domain-containing protein [Planctomycetes bacterium]|nr:substrate-binding domain-containing protein [Planctomycetota bacterium]
MNRQSLAVLPLLAVFPACGSGGPKAVLQSADGKYRVVHQVDARWDGATARTEMQNVLERLPRVDLVYAHDDPMAFAAAQACRQKGRTGVKFVGIDALEHEGRKYVADGAIDATFEYPTGAAAAIDLALLACSGIAPPRRVIVGTRAYTVANLAAGGEPVPSPGEIVLANLRTQHAAVLTTTPTIDVVFRIGMAQCRDREPRGAVMREQLVAAAKRYPQIQFDHRADDDVEKLRGTVRDFVAQNYNAILVSPPQQPSALAAPCQEALAQGIAVIVLDRELGSDDYTCFVGADDLQIGEAAGRKIAELLPDGGAIVEIQGLMTSSQAQERHRGFAKALGLLPVQ